jgi:TRAP-type C4-dicarboxylate transport system permease large subunit
MFVFATASIFSWLLARGGVPAQIVSLPFFAEGANPYVILLALNLLLLLLGTLMEAIAILLIMTPMILPVAVQAGIDLVHLGVVMSFNMSLGLITPPFGPILFVLCGITRCTIAEFSRAVLVFIGVLIVPLALITYLPDVVLFLPNLIMGPE